IIDKDGEERRKHWTLRVIGSSIGFFICSLFSLVIIYGIPFTLHYVGMEHTNSFSSSAAACVSSISPLLRHLFVADLEEEDVSRKPANWTGQEQTTMEWLPRGAFLKGSNLQYAQARKAFLFKANLSGADLFGADLTQAQLKWADLTKIILKEARLEKA